MRRPALLALLMMTSCGAPTLPGASAIPTAQEEACAAQANQDPALEETRGIAAGRLDYQWQHAPEMAQVKRDAITRCLRARGLMPRGGVERPR